MAASTLTWQLDAEALERWQHLEGVYVLKTNLPERTHPLAEVLRTYKGQSQVERRFHHLKGPLAVAPMFLKDPVATPEEARHHRLGDARGEGRGNNCVGRAPAVLEDLRACLRSRRMAGSDSRSHGKRVRGRLRQRPRQYYLPTVLQYKPPSCKAGPYSG